MPPEQAPITPFPPSGPGVTPQPPMAPAPKRSFWHAPMKALQWFWRHIGYKARVFTLLMSAIIVVALIEMLLGIAPKHTSNHYVPTNSSASSGSSASTGATSPGQLSVACGSHGQAFRNNDKYRTGQAPYHIAIFEQSPYYQTQQYDYSFPSDVVTNPVVGPAVRPVAPAETQLVACIDRVSSASTGQSCPYQPVNLPIYSATYQLTVYEAATHRVVLQTPVSSVALDTMRDNCPIRAEYNLKDPRIYYPVDSTGLATILKTLVQ